MRHRERFIVGLYGVVELYNIIPSTIYPRIDITYTEQWAPIAINNPSISCVHRFKECFIEEDYFYDCEFYFHSDID